MASTLAADFSRLQVLLSLVGLPTYAETAVDFLACHRLVGSKAWKVLSWVTARAKVESQAHSSESQRQVCREGDMHRALFLSQTSGKEAKQIHLCFSMSTQTSGMKRGSSRKR